MLIRNLSAGDNPREEQTAGTRMLYLVVAAMLLITLYVRIRLIPVPLERDEGEFAYMGQLILKGIPPYTHAYTMKLPGVALVYAGFMALFGQSITAIHTGLLLVNLLSTILVYLFGKRLFGRQTAAAGSGIFALISSSEYVLGICAHATHFVVLFSMAGVLLLHAAWQKERRLALFMSGIFFGLAVLMKQHAALFIPFAIILLFLPPKKRKVAKSMADSATVILGAALPYVLISIWLMHEGVFGRFWFWTVQYAREYTSENSLREAPAIFYSQFAPVLFSQLPVWVLAAAGAFRVLRQAERRNGIFLIGLFITSFLMTCPGYYFRPHYFILLLPSVALLAACGATAATDFKISATMLTRYKTLLPSSLILISLAYCCYAERSYLFRLYPQEVSRKLFGTNPFPEAPVIADYLRLHTTERDRIAILGSEPEILFYANRISATGHIYMYGLMEKHRYAEQMQAQVMAEIEAVQPAFIVVVHDSASWLLKPDSLNRILDWGDGYIPMRYDEVGIIDIHGDRPTGYLWDDAAAGQNPGAESFVSVYRRRW
ncbi:MAG TPA: glycosyltransferase family 39 protein [Geobacteraceae bacterium]|nr:glycosyltransferase family 39 protein [Geobacteraceae bacterium]